MTFFLKHILGAFRIQTEWPRISLGAHSFHVREAIYDPQQSILSLVLHRHVG